MSHSDSLLLGLKSLREVLSATPVSYANSILSTAINIVEAVQARREADKDLQHLAGRVVELAMTCSGLLAHTDESNSQDIRLYVGTFIKSLESIADSVQKLPRRGMMGRIAGILSKSKSVRDLEAELEHSSGILLLQLQVKNQRMAKNMRAEDSAGQLEVQDAITVAQNQQLELIRTRMMKAAEKYSKESTTFSHHPPPPPQHFYGRKDHVQHLVDGFQTVPSYQAILGPGGIGKTCLSLRVFHDPRTAAFFGTHRYFLSCDSIKDADGLAAGLASIFDLRERNVVSQLKRVCNIIGSSVLFLLDNFETPWEQSNTREKVETILSELTSIPNLSLLITLRGGERPSNVAWTRPFLPVVVPLSLDESKELFVSISDVPEDDPSLEELVIAMEGLPLAVTLLATQAQSSGCSPLLSAWEAQKTSMVTRGFKGRLSSLDSSIQLSIASSRMKTVDSALPILQTLSFLPDGATIDDLALMNPGKTRTPLGATTLCQVSLAYFTGPQRLRVLSPIREYVKSNYPPNLDMFEKIFEHHSKASHYANESEKTPDWKTMVERLALCIGNIHSIIYEALLHESVAFRGIQAAIDVVAFHNCAFLGSIDSLLNASLSKAKSLGFRRLEGDCNLKLARIHLMTPETIQYSSSAILIYRELDAKDLLVEALCLSANFANTNNNDNLAEKNFTEASKVLTGDCSVTNRVRFLTESGRMLSHGGKYASAQANFEDALALLEHQTSPWLTLYFYSCLSAHYVYYDKYDSAIEAGKSGLNIPAVHGNWRNSQVLWGMCQAYYAKGRFSEAEGAASMAFEISLQYAREYNMAWSKYFLAFCAVGNGRMSEAESHVQGALVLLHLAKHLTQRLLALQGLIQLFRNNNAMAAANLEEAKVISDHVSANSGEVFIYHLPMTYLSIRNGSASSSKSFAICSVVWCCRDKQRGDSALALLGLGDTMISEPEPDTTTARSCYEVAFRLFGSLSHRRGIAHTVVRFAAIDRLESASGYSASNPAILFSRAAKLFREIGHYPAEKYCLGQLKSIEANENIDIASLLALPYPM